MPHLVVPCAEKARGALREGKVWDCRGAGYNRGGHAALSWSPPQGFTPLMPAPTNLAFLGAGPFFPGRNVRRPAPEQVGAGGGLFGPPPVRGGWMTGGGGLRGEKGQSPRPARGPPP